MKILVLHVFICDICDSVETISIDSMPYDDPVVTVPVGWNINRATQLECPKCSTKQKEPENGR